MPVTIDLRELQEVTNRLLDHVIRTRGVTSLELDSNFRWQVPEDAIFNMASPPAELDVGSLHDDWEFVRACLNPAREPIAAQFSELAPLFHYVGLVLGKRLAALGG